MYYYAYINESNVVDNVYASETPITEENYIEITEEQYNLPIILYWYHPDTNTFEEWGWTCSTNDIHYPDTNIMITTILDNMSNEIDDKADINHAHSGYASAEDLTTLTDVVATKANATHTHSEYATSTHSHSEYATQVALDALDVEIDSKANVSHIHTEYASISHNHDGVYSAVGHNHDEDYAPLSHTHSDYATTTALNELTTAVSDKASSSHTHDDRYYTETEIDTLLDTKSNTSHTHNYVPISRTINNKALNDDIILSASDVGALPVDTNIPSTLSDLTADSTHRTVTDVEKTTWNAKSNFSGSYNDLTDKPSIPSISGLATETYVDEAVSTKANVSHSHNNLYYTETEINTKLADKSDVSHTHTGVYDVNGAATSALSSANAYTDAEIDALSETVATKASASALTSHTDNATIHVTSNDKNNWNAAKTHASSAHAPVNAEENQNAFSNIVVSDTTISADTKTDTLTLVAGNNITIAPDADGDSITISSVNTVYTHPTSAGNKHIPAGGSSGQILRWASDGTAVWGSDNNTTYSNATQTNSGLMSSTDKVKLDNVAEGANNYTLPSAGSSLGGVKTGGDVTISSGIITVNDDSHNHIISNVDGLQSALNGKAASTHSHDDTYYTETEVDTLLSEKADSSHAHTIANITNLQSTLDGKASISHGNHVSYSTTTPVMDGTATVGTASTVARSDHKHPTDTSRASQEDLDALETVVSGKANTSHTHTIANVTNLQASLDAKQATITGGASTIASSNLTANRALVSNSSGKVAVSDITSTELGYLDGVASNIQTQLDSKSSSSHSHSVATTSTAGLMSASDKSKLNGIASGANAYTLPTASSTLGGVKTTSTVTSASGYTACPIISGVPYYKDTNTTYSLSSFGITATAAELNYVDGVTSNIQTQLDSKASSSHTHSVATTSANGFMSSTDKAKLNGIATGANAYTHPSYTARTGVPTANATLSHGGTFTVTQPVCDATGHVTALNTRTYTLPTDNNTDTKVTNTLATTTKAYVTGTTSATTNTGTQVFDTGVYLDTTAGKLTATTFNGTTFSGSGIATTSEVKNYLGI